MKTGDYYTIREKYDPHVVRSRYEIKRIGGVYCGGSGGFGSLSLLRAIRGSLSSPFRNLVIAPLRLSHTIVENNQSNVSNTLFNHFFSSRRGLRKNSQRLSEHLRINRLQHWQDNRNNVKTKSNNYVHTDISIFIISSRGPDQIHLSL